MLFLCYWLDIACNFPSQKIRNVEIHTVSVFRFNYSVRSDGSSIDTTVNLVSREMGEACDPGVKQHGKKLHSQQGERTKMPLKFKQVFNISVLAS
ncbi:hypothetical protein AKJ16_DCAP09080 [Drosera capensis]